jgi:hypothetical protein
MNKVDVYFPLGSGGKFSISHLQMGEGPFLTWLPFVHPNKNKTKRMGK